MSALSEKFAMQLRGCAISFVAEYKFHPTRKWRFDFAFPEKKLAVEIDGGTWIGGRHTTGAGFEKDCEKKNEAVKLGWRILTFTGKHLRNGEAIQILEDCLNGST